MSLVTFVRDYVQDPDRIVHIPSFIFDGCKESFLYIFSFQWFRNLTYITLSSPSFTETFGTGVASHDTTLTSTPLLGVVAEGGATPYFGESSLLNHGLLGFINGITSTFSFCAVTIVVFHVLLNENKNRAFRVALIGCLGDVSYIAFILFGFRSLIIPWLNLEPLNYVLSLTIQLFFALAIIKDNRKIRATLSRAIPYNMQGANFASRDKNKIGATTQSGQLSYNVWIAPSLFLFSWCEQGGIFQNVGLLGAQPSGSFLQTPKLFSAAAFAPKMGTLYAPISGAIQNKHFGREEIQLQVFIYLLIFIVTRIIFTWIILSISQNLIEWKDETSFSFSAIKDGFSFKQRIKDLSLINILNEIFTKGINFLYQIGRRLNINGRNNVTGSPRVTTFGAKENIFRDTVSISNTGSGTIENRFTRRLPSNPLRTILRDPIAIAAVTCSLAFLPAYSTNLLITKSVGFFPEENRTSYSLFSPWDLPGEVLGIDMDHVSNRNHDNNFPEYSFFLPFYDKGDYGGWLGLGEEDVRYEPFYLWRSRRIRAPWRKTNLQEPSSIFTNDKSLFTNPNLNLQQKETTNIKQGLSLLNKKLFFSNGDTVHQPVLTPKTSAKNNNPSVPLQSKGGLQRGNPKDIPPLDSKQQLLSTTNHPSALPTKIEKSNKYTFLRTRLTEPVLMKFNRNNVFSPTSFEQRESLFNNQASVPSSLASNVNESNGTSSYLKPFLGSTAKIQEKWDIKLNNKNHLRISKEGRKKLVENFKKPERVKTQVIKPLKKDANASPFSLFFARLYRKTEHEQGKMPMEGRNIGSYDRSASVNFFNSAKEDKIGRIRATSKRVKEFKFLKKKFQFLKIKDRKKSLKKSSQSVHLKYLKAKKKNRQSLDKSKYISKLRRQYPYIRNVKERKLSLFGFYLPTFNENTSGNLRLNAGTTRAAAELYKEKNKPLYWKGYPKKKDSINYKEDLNLVFRSQMGEDLDFAQEEIQARIFKNPYIRFLLNFRVDNFLSREKLLYNSPYKGSTKGDGSKHAMKQTKGQENQPLTLKAEQELFKRRLIISKYADTVNFLKPNLNHSYTDRIYNHQFKGTLSTARRLFSLKVKYDQPLVHSLDYKPAIENEDLKLRSFLSTALSSKKQEITQKDVIPIDTFGRYFLPKMEDTSFLAKQAPEGQQSIGVLATKGSAVLAKGDTYPFPITEGEGPQSNTESDGSKQPSPDYGSSLKTRGSKNENSNNVLNTLQLNSVFEKSCLAPLYVAWEPESRKLVYTNRYLNYENTFSSFGTKHGASLSASNEATLKDHRHFTNWPLQKFYFKNNEFFFSQLYSNSRPIDSYLSQENEKARPIALPRRVTSLNTVLNAKSKGQPTDAQNSQNFLKLEKNEKKVFLFKHSWNPTMNGQIQGTKDKQGNIQKITSNGFYLPASAEQQKIAGIEEREYPLWMVFRTLPPSQGGFLWPGD